MSWQEANVIGDDCVADDLVAQSSANLSAGGVCVTTGGTVPESTACSFPFAFDGVTYSGCTGDGDFGLGGFWCSTDTEFDGHWGYCNCSPTFSDMQQACPSEVATCLEDQQCLMLLNAQLQGEMVLYADYFTFVEDGYLIGNFIEVQGTLTQCYTACADGTWAGCVGFSRPVGTSNDDQGGICSWVSSLVDLEYDDENDVADLYVGNLPALAIQQCLVLGTFEWT